MDGPPKNPPSLDPPDPHAEPELDKPSLQLLQDYLDQLHNGQAPDPDACLQQCPQLKPYLDCLHALEALAPAEDESQQIELLVRESLEGPAPDLPVRDQSAKSPTVHRDRAQGSDSKLTLGDGVGSHDPTLALSSSQVMPVTDGEYVDGYRRPPCKQFGAYELLYELGRGGMGVVYLARQPGLNRHVAVKMILASQLASDEQVRRFRAEAQAAAALTHANVVQIFDVGEVEGQHYFAMQYVRGQSLAERLAVARPSPDEGAQTLAAVARAVHHLHQNHIIHRDLKPGNVLIDAAGEPYVTDFGLAKMLAGDDPHTATGVITGTPSYMSPEQATGRQDVGPASDVYSLGVILYEILTGRPPFREDNPLDTLVQVIEREPQLPRQRNPKVPAELELICLKCLEKSPAERYGTAAELADDLERYLRGEAVEAQPPSVRLRVWRWGRREPALATRLGAMAVLYTVESINYLLGVVDARFHWLVTAVLACWAVMSVLFQRLLRRPQWAMVARYGWAATDVLGLTGILLVADGVASPMVLGFPLVIVASGLWFQIRMVYFATAASLLAYSGLIFRYYAIPMPQRPVFDPDFDRHVYVLVGLCLIGCMVAYQVSRVRALSRYYESRRTP